MAKSEIPSQTAVPECCPHCYAKFKWNALRGYYCEFCSGDLRRRIERDGARDGAPNNRFSNV